jgi:hypothetical protein
LNAYTHTLTLTAPASLLSVASAIARALDPDTGGADSWQTVGDVITMSTPCTEQFYNEALYLLTEPQALHTIVSDDYETRWADLTPPTLEQCNAFRTGVILVLDPIEP